MARVFATFREMADFQTGGGTARQTAGIRRCQTISAHKVT